MLEKMLSRLKPLCNLPISNLNRTLPTSTHHPIQRVPSRNYKIAAGKAKTQPPNEKPSPNGQPTYPTQGDYSGFHKTPIIKTCKDQYQCYNRHCDSTDSEICPHKTDKALVVESAGALTHKIPKNKEGVQLDTYDAQGHPKPQYLVTEKTTIPLDIAKFKEDEKTTEFVQQSHIAERIRKAMPANSRITLKITSINDTPPDNENV